MLSLHPRGCKHKKESILVYVNCKYAAITMQNYKLCTAILSNAFLNIPQLMNVYMAKPCA